MAQENYNRVFARTAGGTILRGQALTVNSAGNVIATTAITDVVVGVALEGCASGEQCNFVGPGNIVTALAGAAITPGAQVMPQATGPGKFVTAAGATAISCGIALTNPGADNGLFELFFLSNARGPANA